MKKRIVLAAILALALAPAMSTLRAEEQEQQEHGMKDKMKEKLGLTDDQVKKLDDLRASEKAEMKPLREKAHAIIEKLEGQVKSKASDSDIKATLDEAEANHAAVEQLEDKFKQSHQAILTPTQQAKMLLHRMKHERMEKGEKGDKGDKKDKDKDEKEDGDKDK